MSVVGSERWKVVSPFLDRALEMVPADRVRWVAALRSDDPALADELEALLRRREVLSQEGFLATLPARPIGPSAAGETIGPYALVSPIGTGGTGVVWLARRSDGRFDGMAAIKLLNPELVGQVGQGRFEREARILAQLSHPHVAHLIDAGVSPAGQPYLVLERVDGDHIDHFCDDRRMAIEARVRLFLDLLGAVAHAHGHLVVHRDIKPSNVLVTRDGRVKLLDFGIAKLLDREGGQVSALTREGGQALTPAYAAPEQVTGGSITTATDVYALGVLLHVLLGGVHPAGDSVRSPAELIKAIVEDEPPRLSTLVGPAGARGTAEPGENAARRATTPDRLRRILSGDLDTIVAKALKKTPRERYPSVTDLADDLRRYLEHQPIRARPDAVAYRAVKFVRRNRAPVALAALVATAMLAGTVATVAQAERASAEAERASAEAERADSMRRFMFDAFAQAEPGAPRVGPASVVDAVERAIAATTADGSMDPRVRLELLIHLVQVLDAQGALERARGLLVPALARAGADFGAADPLVLEAEATLFWNEVLRGEFAAARGRADRLLARLPAHEIRLRAEVLRRSANLATKQGDRARALGEARRAVDLSRSSGDSAILGDALDELGNAFLTAGALPEAIRTYEELLALRRQRYGDEHAEVADVEASLSRAYRRSGSLDRAEAHARSAVAIDRKVYPGDHWRTGLHLNALAMLLHQRRAFAELLEVASEALRVQRATLGDNHPDTLNSLHNLGMAHVQLEEFAAAVPLLREALGGRTAQLGAEHARTTTTRASLGRALAESGRVAEGVAAIDEAIAAAEGLADPEPTVVAECLEKRIRVALHLGEPASALPFLERMGVAAAKLPASDAYWAGRVDTLRGEALLALGRNGEASAALEEAARALAASTHPDAVLSVEVPLRLAAAARALGDQERSRALARDGRARLEALPNPPARLTRLARLLGP